MSLLTGSGLGQKGLIPAKLLESNTGSTLQCLEHDIASSMSAEQ